MKMIYKIIIIALILVSTLSFSGCIDRNAVTYEVVFNATWSEETHPDDFPSNPHFSGLIGATHNSEVFFWREGELSSSGIKSMAETGSKRPLNIEVLRAILHRTAFRIISGGVINPSPGSVSLEFKVSKNFPLVTLVSMVAPSPDWFVGVDSLSLYENGSFVNEKTVVLYAYDAGTDSGTNYTSPDDPTDPPVPVFKIEGYPFFYDDELVPVGTFTFRKVKDDSIS
ncbi:MAG: spondin domain-containing protein [Thermoplasmatales archaeon]|nr:MAG: spondin domain-containing protein [Thermoplasmatales archaeon]